MRRAETAQRAIPPKVEELGIACHEGSFAMLPARARAVSRVPGAAACSRRTRARFRFLSSSGGPARSRPARIPAEIWEFPLDGGESRRVVENANGQPAPLVSAPAPGAYGAAPATDGFVYYTSVTPRPYGSRQGASSAVHRLDPESGDDQPVVLGSTAAMKPLPAPDGTFLVYAAEVRGQTGLKLRDVATGDERWLAYPIQRHQLESRATRDVLPNYAISADSKTVFAAYGGKIRAIDIETGAASIVPFTADVELQARPRLAFPREVDQGPIRPRRYQRLALGPDGTMAVATTGRIYTLGNSDPVGARSPPVRSQPSWQPPSILR